MLFGCFPDGRIGVAVVVEYRWIIGCAVIAVHRVFAAQYDRSVFLLYQDAGPAGVLARAVIHAAYEGHADVIFGDDRTRRNLLHVIVQDVHAEAGVRTVDSFSEQLRRLHGGLTSFSEGEVDLALAGQSALGVRPAGK